MQNCFIFIWMNQWMYACVVPFANNLHSNVCMYDVDPQEPSQSTVRSRLSGKSFMNILNYMHRTFCIRVFELKIQSFCVVCMHDSKQYLHYTLHYSVGPWALVVSPRFSRDFFFPISTSNDCRLLYVYKQILDSVFHCATTTGIGYQML